MKRQREDKKATGKNARSAKPEKESAKVKSAPPKKAPAKSAARKQVESNLIPVAIKTHKDKKGGHPHVIMEDIEDKHVSVGLSTKPTKGKGSKNYRLEKSPLNDGRQSYLRRQGMVAPKKEYSGKRQGDMTQKDYERAKEYAERAKQKYLREKKDKKK